MVAATEEERLPALPVRSSSREFGHGTAAGTKVVLFAVLGAVALVGVGAGVAFQQGLLSTSILSGALQPQRESDNEFLTVKHRGKQASEAATDQLVDAGSSSAEEDARRREVAAEHAETNAEKKAHDKTEVHSGVDSNTADSKKVDIHHAVDRTSQEYLAEKAAHDHSKARIAIDSKRMDADSVSQAEKQHQQRWTDALKQRHAGNSSKAHNQTHAGNSSKAHNQTHAGNSSKAQNKTQANNMTDARNGTHSRNKTKAHNQTGVANRTGAHNSTNSSHARNKTRGHTHLTCTGGSLAACQCLFACKVFGSQPSQCSGAKVDLIDTLIQKALSNTREACFGMRCIVRCAKSLKCYDEQVQNDCRALDNRSKGLGHNDKHMEGGQCRYECEEDKHDVLSQ